MKTLQFKMLLRLFYYEQGFLHSTEGTVGFYQKYPEFCTVQFLGTPYGNEKYDVLVVKNEKGMSFWKLFYITFHLQKRFKEKTGEVVDILSSDNYPVVDVDKQPQFAKIKRELETEGTLEKYEKLFELV